MSSMSTRSVVGAVGGCVAGLILIATVFSSAAERADIVSFSSVPPHSSAAATPDLVPPQPPSGFASPTPTPTPPTTPPAPPRRPVVHRPVVPPKPSATVVPRPKKPTAAPTCPSSP